MFRRGRLSRIHTAANPGSQFLSGTRDTWQHESRNRGISNKNLSGPFDKRVAPISTQVSDRDADLATAHITPSPLGRAGSSIAAQWFTAIAVAAIRMMNQHVGDRVSALGSMPAPTSA